MDNSSLSPASVTSAHTSLPVHTLPNEPIVDKILYDIGAAVWPTGRKFSSSGVATLRSSSSVIASTPKPRTIPLYIPLSTNLTDLAEITCAETVAEHLSSKCGRAIGLSDLEGLFLYLWSEDDPDGRALDDYLGDNSRPLQALLLQIRNLEGQAESLARAELLAFVGQRFEILAGEGQFDSLGVVK